MDYKEVLEEQINVLRKVSDEFSLTASEKCELAETIIKLIRCTRSCLRCECGEYEV